MYVRMQHVLLYTYRSAMYLDPVPRSPVPSPSLPPSSSRSPVETEAETGASARYWRNRNSCFRVRFCLLLAVLQIYQPTYMWKSILHTAPLGPLPPLRPHLPWSPRPTLGRRKPGTGEGWICTMWKKVQRMTPGKHAGGNEQGMGGEQGKRGWQAAEDWNLEVRLGFDSGLREHCLGFFYSV